MNKLTQIYQLITTLRILRVVNVLKLVLRSDKLLVIYRTLAETISVLGEFSILLLIMLFMFSVIAVQLFALVDLRPIDGLNR